MSKNLLFNLLICKCADVQIEISNLLVANLNSVEITNCDWYSSYLVTYITISNS